MKNLKIFATTLIAAGTLFSAGTLGAGAADDLTITSSGTGYGVDASIGKLTFTGSYTWWLFYSIAVSVEDIIVQDGFSAAIAGSNEQTISIGSFSLGSGSSLELRQVIINTDLAFSSETLKLKTVTMNGRVKVSGGTFTAEDTTFSGITSYTELDGGGAFYLTWGNTVSSLSGTFSGNSGYRGGALRNDGTITTLSADFTNNTATSGDAGAIYNGGTIVSLTGTFTSNTAASNGGAINNWGKITTISADFTSNEATVGGAIYNDKNSGTIGTITGNFTNNKATSGDGGAIYNTGTINSISGTFDGNYAGAYCSGGAIYNNAKVGTISGTFKNNAAYTNGGVIYNESAGTIDSITGEFTNNSAEHGGGGTIANSGTITTISGTFTGNSAGYNGGAIGNYGGTIESISGTFTNNTATSNNGGAIFNNGTITIVAETSNTTFTGNRDSTGSNAIHNYNSSSVVNLNVSEGYSIIFNDAISGSSGTINVVAESAGTVEFNVAVSGNNINIYGGTVSLGSAVNSLSNVTLDGGEITGTNYSLSGTITSGTISGGNVTIGGISAGTNVSLLATKTTSSGAINLTGTLTLGGTLALSANNLSAYKIFVDTNKSAEISTTGTITGGLSMGKNSALTVNGGKVATAWTLNNSSAELTLKNTTVSNALTVSAGTLNVGTGNTLNGVVVTGNGLVSLDSSITSISNVTLDGGEITGTSYSVSGTISSGTVTGTNISLSDVADTDALTISATSTLELSGTSVLDNAGTTVSAGTLNLTSGASLTTSNGATISAGTLNLTNANATISGTVTGTTTLESGSTLTQTSGTLGEVSVKGSSTFTQTAGTAGAVSANASTLDLAGTVASVSAESSNISQIAKSTGNVYLVDTSVTTMGSVGGDLTLNSSSATVTGTVSGATVVRQNSTLTQTAGTLATVELSGSSTFTQTAGTAGSVTAYNSSLDLAGTVASVSAESSNVAQIANATGNVSLANTTNTDATKIGSVGGELHLTKADAEVSGTVSGQTLLEGDSELTQTSGALGTVRLLLGSTFTQTAGTAGDIFAESGTTLDLAGTVDSVYAYYSNVVQIANATGDVDLATTMDAEVVKIGSVGGTLTLTADAEISGTVLGKTTASYSEITLTETSSVADIELMESSASVAGTVSGTLTIDADSDAAIKTETASVNAVSVAGTLILDGKLDSEITLNGGEITGPNFGLEQALMDATGTISGENVTLNGLTDSGTLTITATESLTLAGSTTLDNADSTISAGTLELAESANLTLANGATATVTGTLTFAENSSLKISNSTFTGDITVNDSTVELYLTDATIDGDLTMNAGTLEISGANSVSGTVYIDSSIDFTQATSATLTAGALSISGENTQVTIGGKVTGESTVEAGAILTQDENGTLGAVSVNAATFKQVSGTADSVSATNGVVSLAGTVTGDVTGTGSRITVATGGQVKGMIELNCSDSDEDNAMSASLTVEADATVDEVNVYNTTLDIAGTAGSVGATNSNVVQIANATGTISLFETTNDESSPTEIGSVDGILQLWKADATVSGTVTGTAIVEGSSTLTQTAGTIFGIAATGATFVQEVAGTVTGQVWADRATLDLAGTVGRVSADESNVIQIANATDSVHLYKTTNTEASAIGSVDGALDLIQSDATVSGTVTGTTTVTNSELTILSTGIVATIESTDSTVTVDGKAADISLTNSSAEIAGTVTGTLTIDGDSSATVATGTAKVNAVSVAGTLNLEDGKFDSNISLNGGEIAGTNYELVNALENATGTISGENITLAGVDDAGENGALTITATKSVAITGTTTLENANSTILATGAGSTIELGDTTLGDSVLVRANSNVMISGDLTTGEGAVITSWIGDVTIDATDGTTGTISLGEGSIVSAAGTITLAGTEISVGEDAMLTGTNIVLDGEATFATGTTLEAYSNLEIADGADVSFAGTEISAKSLTLGDGATLELTDGATYTGDITLDENSTATVVITNAEIIGNLTAEAGTLTLTDATISGNLTMNAGTLTLTGENAVMGTVVVEEAVSLTIAENATIVASSLQIAGADLDISGDMTGDLDLTGGSTTTVSGTVDGTATVENSEISITEDGSVTTIVATDDSEIKISGTVTGTLDDDGNLADKTEVTLSLTDSSATIENSGSVAGTISANGSILDIAGTADTIVATDKSEITIKENGSADLIDATNSTVTINAGGSADDITATSSTVEIAGTADFVVVTDNSKITISGEVEYLAVKDNSTGTVSGKVDEISVENSSSATISGTAGMVSATEKSTVEISGTVSEIVAESGSTITISGEVTGTKTGADLLLENTIDASDSTVKIEETATVAGTIFVENSEVSIAGTVTGQILAQENSSVEIKDSAKVNAISIGTDSTATIAGTANLVTASKAEKVTISGTVSDLVWATLGSTLEVAEGGEVAGMVIAADSEIMISGTVAGTVSVGLSKEHADDAVSILTIMETGKTSDISAEKSTVMVAGTVSGTAEIIDSSLTQYAGTLAEVSATNSKFTQYAGTANSVSMTNSSATTSIAGTVKAFALDNSAMKVEKSGTIGAGTLTNGSSLELAGTPALNVANGDVVAFDAGTTITLDSTAKLVLSYEKSTGTRTLAVASANANIDDLLESGEEITIFSGAGTLSGDVKSFLATDATIAEIAETGLILYSTTSGLTVRAGTPVAASDVPEVAGVDSAFANALFKDAAAEMVGIVNEATVDFNDPLLHALISGDSATAAKIVRQASPMGYAAMLAAPAKAFQNDARAILARLENFVGNAKIGEFDGFAQVMGTKNYNSNGARSMMFDLDSVGILAGAMTAVSAETAVGLSVGIEDGNADIHSHGGKIDFYDVRLMAFAGTTFAERFFVNGGAEIVFSDFDARRSSAYGNSKGDANGTSAGVFANAGTWIDLTADGKLVAIPRVGLSYMLMSAGAMEETGGNALEIEGFSGESLRASVACEFAWRTELAGTGVRFGLDFEYAHDFLGDDCDIDFAWNGNDYSVTAKMLSRDSFSVSPSVSVELTPMSEIYANYVFEAGDHSEQHRGNVGYRLKF